MHLQLSILTLNIWGIPYISKDRIERLEAIGDAIANGNYDLVSLQEVWALSDYDYLKQRLKASMPYSYYFHSGVFGSGLCVFSKHIIISTLFHSWSVNGYVHRIQHGDWFGGKGVGLCKILIQNKYLVHFYTAHLHAEYNRNCDDYKSHRIIQAFDTAQFIESTRGDCVAQILAGDLNTEPGDLAYQILLDVSKLQDSCDTNHHIGTNECADNSYTLVPRKEGKGIRIDYILFRKGSQYQASIVHHALPFSKRIPGKQISYSDHEAVNTILDITSNSSHDENRHDPLSVCNILKEAINICNDSLENLTSHRKTYFMLSTVVLVGFLCVMDLVPPYGLKTAYLFVKILLSGLILFFIIMATMWNQIERHGVLSGKLAMEVLLESLTIATTETKTELGETKP